jgi:methionine-rich copper-binding protein CopC
MAFNTEAGYAISWFYAAAFARTPVPNSSLPDNGDLGGLTFWTNQFLGGPDAQPQYVGDVYAIADFFVASPEFIAQYPLELTNSQFVTALYNNMLSRAPDLAGFNFWVGRLDQGDSRGEVLADFSNTPENQASDPLRQESLQSFVLFIANDNDGVITPAEADVWLAANPTLDGALVDLTSDTTPPVVEAGQTDTYSEGSAAGATLFTVEAADNENGSGLAGFAIASGNDKGYFAIDNSGNISLTTAGAVAGTASNSATVDPDVFTLGITATDKAGNTSTPVDVVLTVADITPPAVSAALVGPTAVILAYSETLNSSKLPLPTDFSVTQNGTTSISVNTVTISGSSVTLALAAAPTGTITVSYTPNADVNRQLQDPAGNVAAALTNQAAQADTTPPTKVSSTPADGATDVAVGSNLVLNFSETVKAGTGNIVIANSADGTDTRTIAVTDTTQVTFSGSTVTINPTADLKADGSYTVTMNAGVITDLVGNSFAGLSGTDLNFNTPGGGGGTGNTLVLTVGVDNLSPTSPAPFNTTDNDDTIQGENAVVNTINPADVLNGGGGTDRANFFIQGTKTGQLTSTAVENFFIQATQNGAAVADEDSTFNAVAVTGAQQWWSNNSQENLIVSNVASLATVGIIGGVDVGSDGTGDADYKVNFNSGIASASATLSVVAQGALIDDLQVGNADGSQEFGTVTINTTVANSSIDDIKDGAGNDPAGLTKVLFTGNTRMTIGSELEDVTTFDSTGSTGGARVVIDENKAVTFTGGAGADRVDVNNAAGAGLTSADKLDGGGGTADVFRIRHDQNLTAGDVANVKNWDIFEGFAQVGVADATYDLDIFVANNAFVGVQVSSGAAANLISITNIPGAAAAAIRVVNDIDDVTLAVRTFVPGGTSDTATILVDNANNSAAGKASGVDITGPLTFTNVDVLNIQSISDGSPAAAEQNSIGDLLAADMNKLVITGDQDFAVTTNAASLELTEVDASGMSLVTAEGLAFTATGTAISSLLIRGTAKNDTLLVNNAATTATIFTGGGTDAVTIEGTLNDSLNFTATAFNAGDVKAGNVVTVTGVAAANDLTVAFAGAFNNLLKVGGATLGTSLANVALTAAFNTTPAGLTNVIYVDDTGAGNAELRFDLNGDGLYTQTDDFAIVLVGSNTAAATYNATTDTFAFT